MGKKRKHKIKQLTHSFADRSFESAEVADQVFHDYLNALADEELLLAKKGLLPEPSKAPAKVSFPKRRQVDLHGLTLHEALRALDATLQDFLASSQKRLELTVITGKGLHSGAAGGVLVKEVHAYLLRTYRKCIFRIDPSPHETLVNGLPLRGFFNVILHNHKNE